jgi:hypothetical protein
MRTLPLAIAISCLLFAVPSRAQQSATLTFGAPGSSNCSRITEWNGVTNAYPEDMGEVCFNFYPNFYSGILIPWQLGFPNNGFLPTCEPTVWGAKTYTKGNGTQAGDTFSQTMTATCPYNVTLEVTGSFVVEQITHCYYRRCFTTYANVLESGSGTVTD